MVVQMVDGAGDIQIEIASVKTGQVVAERRFHDVKTPVYVGAPPAFPKKEVFYLYKVSPPPAPSQEGENINNSERAIALSIPYWELRFEAESKTTINVTMMGLSGPITGLGAADSKNFSNLSPQNNVPPSWEGAGGGKWITGTCVGTCTWRFSPTPPSDPVAEAFSIQVGFGGSEFIFSNPPLYIGPFLKQAAYNPTVFGDENAGTVMMVWDKKNLGGTGYVSGGDYLVRVSATGVGMDGHGYVEVTRSITVATPYDVF
jgi:hypothetical protein